MNSQKIHSNDDIGIESINILFKKHWKSSFIGGVFGLTFAIASIYASKPIYQANFKLLVSSEAPTGINALLSQNPLLQTLGGTSNGSNSIFTTVELLQSELVLFNVYKSINNDLLNKGQPVFSSFKDWIESSLSVNNEKGTSLIDVKYKDSNKDSILNRSDLIISAYQAYSISRRNEELDKLTEFLQQQISILKPKSRRSADAATMFGYKHGLGILDGLPIAGNVSSAVSSDPSDNKIAGGGTLELAKTAAQQEVRTLEVQIVEAKKAGAGSLYFASEFASLTDKSSTFDKLTSVEAKLAEMNSRLLPNDPIIRRLTRERNSLITYINNQTISLLQGELDLARAKLYSLDRPLDLVANHRDLTQVALRDEATLVSLENRLKTIQLEKARDINEWEIVSGPNLLPYPISPRKLRVSAFGLAIGSILGLIFSTFYSSNMSKKENY